MPDRAKVGFTLAPPSGAREVESRTRVCVPAVGEWVGAQVEGSPHGHWLASRLTLRCAVYGCSTTRFRSIIGYLEREREWGFGVRVVIARER